MAEKNVQMAPEGAPQSATIASGSTHTAGNVMISWTTTISSQQIVTTAQKLLDQLKVANPADLD